MLYLVEFTGPFGFLKPWTAVRDGRTGSLTFLTPSTLEGMRRKLGVAAIKGNRLTFAGTDWQQEVTHAQGWTPSGRSVNRIGTRPRAVITRGVLLFPRLVLAFASLADARLAAHQHLCLSRNEDVLMPTGEVVECSVRDFELVPGTEFQPAAADTPGAVLVGHNYNEGNAPMYGRVFHQPASGEGGLNLLTYVH